MDNVDVLVLGQQKRMSMKGEGVTCGMMSSVVTFGDRIAVFCPGFQKGRVPSEKGTLAWVKRAL